MKKWLFIILLVIQAGFLAAQEPVGTFDPQEDQTVLNETGAMQVVMKWTNAFLDYFKEKKPEGYVDGPFANFFSVLARILLVVLLHLYYTKVRYRKPRQNKDYNKVVYRYKFTMIAFAVILTLSMLSISFLWSILLAVAYYVVILTCVDRFETNLCDFCCCYGHVKSVGFPLDEYCTEIYGTKTHTSQYVQADEITKDMLPEGGYKIYKVQRYRYENHCAKCDNTWETLSWKRLEE